MVSREFKFQNVARIEQAKQYKKEKLKEKIEFDIVRSEQIEKDKKEMLGIRVSMRKQADEQRREMVKTVE